MVLGCSIGGKIVLELARLHPHHFRALIGLESAAYQAPWYDDTGWLHRPDVHGGELCVCQMTAVLDLAASTVSAHLADLKRAGLVGERKDGRWVFHRLEEGEAAQALLAPVWRAIARDPQVEADARLLRELRRVDVEELCRVDLDLKRLGIRRPAAGALRA